MKTIALLSALATGLLVVAGCGSGETGGASATGAITLNYLNWVAFNTRFPAG